MHDAIRRARSARAGRRISSRCPVPSSARSRLWPPGGEECIGCQRSGQAVNPPPNQRSATDDPRWAAEYSGKILVPRCHAAGASHRPRREPIRSSARSSRARRPAAEHAGDYSRPVEWSATPRSSSVGTGIRRARPSGLPLCGATATPQPRWTNLPHFLPDGRSYMSDLRQRADDGREGANHPRWRGLAKYKDRDPRLGSGPILTFAAGTVANVRIKGPLPIQDSSGVSDLTSAFREFAAR